MKRPGKRHTRLKRFYKDILLHTPFAKMLMLLIVLWMIFSGSLYLAEQSSDHPSLSSLGEAMYWGIAAFSTAGIADTPNSGLAQLIGGLWIVIGSSLFFGAIVATITGYFMRPTQRPHKQIIDTIEYNLEQLNDLSMEELDLLKETIDTLIVHVEQLNERKAQ
ncbi:MAG: two pore domain potassium channel family protein [Candidatus Thiodiazotropha sp.]|jgi:voltage-gated potassium channel